MRERGILNFLCVIKWGDDRGGGGILLHDDREMTWGEGGVFRKPKFDDVICAQTLVSKWTVAMMSHFC